MAAATGSHAGSLSRTDLLVSHEFRGMGSQRIRLELNVLNLFNQKTATHIFNSAQPRAFRRAAPGVGDPSVRRRSERTGYDYNALLRATADGANSYDPRFGQEDLFNPGTAGPIQREVHVLSARSNGATHEKGRAERLSPFL